MKRVISSDSNNITVEDKLLEDISDILYNAGYDVVSDGELKEDDLHLLATSRQDVDKMPELKLEIERDGQYYYCTPTLNFPQLDINTGDFTDSIEHWLNKWHDLGKYITRLCDYVLDVEDFESRPNE